MRVFAGIVVLVSSLLVLASRGQDANAPVNEHEAIVQEMLGVFDKITEGLKTVNDAESAAAAKDGLTQAAAQWQKVRARANALKPPAKDDKQRLETYAEKLVIAQKQLFGQIGRVISVPGGRELLKELSGVLDKSKKTDNKKAE